MPQVLNFPYSFLEFVDDTILCIGNSHITKISLGRPIKVEVVKEVSSSIEIQLPKIGFFQKYVSIRNSVSKWESKVQNNNTSLDYTAMTQKRHQQRASTLGKKPQSEQVPQNK